MLAALVFFVILVTSLFETNKKVQYHEISYNSCSFASCRRTAVFLGEKVAGQSKKFLKQ